MMFSFFSFPFPFQLIEGKKKIYKSQNTFAEDVLGGIRLEEDDEMMVLGNLESKTHNKSTT